MTSETDHGSARPVRQPPERITSSTKVTVAFPFSRVKIEEPSENMVALTGLVQELAQLLAESAPSTKADELLRRACDLAAATH
jgi:hypothetical protein